MYEDLDDVIDEIDELTRVYTDVDSLSSEDDLMDETIDFVFGEEEE